MSYITWRRTAYVKAAYHKTTHVGKPKVRCLRVQRDHGSNGALLPIPHMTHKGPPLSLLRWCNKQRVSQLSFGVGNYSRATKHPFPTLLHGALRILRCRIIHSLQYMNKFKYHGIAQVSRIPAMQRLAKFLPRRSLLGHICYGGSYPQPVKVL